MIINSNIVENNVLIDVDRLSCNTCEYEGNDSFAVKEHIALNHDNRISDSDIEKLGGMILTEFFCNLCDFVAENNHDLKMHSELAHESRNTVTAAENPGEHLSPAHDDNLMENEIPFTKYNCGKCDYLTKDIEELNNHIDSFHRSSDSETKCKKCLVQLKNPEDLESHMDEAHIICRVFSCPQCKYRTTALKEFRIHSDTQHLQVQVNIPKQKTADDLKTDQIHLK